MNKVIIADDNLVFVKRLYNVISEQVEDIHCIALATSGKETIYNITKYQPDILLLDLEMPNGNGIDVIKFIDEHQYSTKIIVISAYLEKLYTKYPNLLSKVAYALSKPFEIKHLIHTINSILEDNIEKSIEKYVIGELEKFNFNRKSIGYKYLITTIITVIKREKIRFNLEHDIYEKVAKIYSVSRKNTIKWTIDKLIKQMCYNTDAELISSYFHSNAYKKVTAKLLVTTIFDKYNNIIHNKMLII